MADSSTGSAADRCLALAAHHAGSGEAARARGMVGLALNLAVPAELEAVITAADGVLASLDPSPRPAAVPAPAPVLEPVVETVESAPAREPEETPPSRIDPEPVAERPAGERRPRERPAPKRRTGGGWRATPMVGAVLLIAVILGGIGVAIASSRSAARDVGSSRVQQQQLEEAAARSGGR